jgi:hypothetical protein
MGKKSNTLQIVNGKYIDRMLNNKIDVTMFSRLNNEIPDDAKIALYKITADASIIDCNEKADLISAIMTNLGFVEIGCGTNRIAFRKHNYVFKVALDKRGWIDNISEYKRSIEFPQYFMKVYETNREIVVCEYCELISEDYFMTHKDQVKQILSILSNYYIMDDVGLTTKNFCNWGIRTTTSGDEVMVLIDNAYFYPLRNKEMITCSCGSRIVPSDDFTYYKCSNSACTLHYSVAEILNMSRFDYDGEDEEAVKVMTTNGSESYIKVSGTNSGHIERINKAEAERLLSNYKDASRLDQPDFNIQEDIENYWLNNTDNDSKDKDDDVIPYNTLNLGGNKQ